MRDRGPCQVAECERRAWARGMCNLHYGRWRKTASTDTPYRQPRASGVCKIDGCDRTEWARGMCPLHYGRVRRSGTVELLTATTEARFWAKVEQGEGCWAWIGHVMPNGYGMFYPPGRKVPAHRYAYELLTGPIPAGLHIDHLCRNRGCVNPSHLEAVTQAENNRRAWLVRAGKVA